MAVIKKAARFLVGGLLGSVLGLGGKKQRDAQPIGQPTRDDAAATLANDDELRRRRGGSADILTGATGAEAALSGGRLVLGN